jgi:hypothetical protein
MNRLAPGQLVALSRPAEAMFPREVGPGRLALTSPVCEGGSTGPLGAGRSLLWR